MWIIQIPASVESPSDSSTSSVELLSCVGPVGSAVSGTSQPEVTTSMMAPAAKEATSAEDMDISESSTHKATEAKSAITLSREQSDSEASKPASHRAPPANDSELSDGEVRDNDDDDDDNDDQGGAGVISGALGDDTLTPQEEERILGRSTPLDKQVTGTEDDILGHVHDKVGKWSHPSLRLLSPPRRHDGFRWATSIKGCRTQSAS